MSTFRLTLFLIAILLIAPQASCGIRAEARSPAGHDEIALADMRQFAQQQLATGRELPRTYRVIDNWSASFVLSWADFPGPHGTVRVYHATHKHHPSRRYVSFSDGHQGRHHHWHAVH